MAFEPVYPLLGERVSLRPFTRGDVEGVYAYRHLPDVAQFLLDEPLTHEDVAIAIRRRVGQTQFRIEGDTIMLAVVLNEGHQLIGEISLIWRSMEARQAEIGWIFHPEYQGKGLAFEASSLVIELAFEGGGIHRVFARCDARNVASARLMERLGMRREAHFKQHARFKGQWDEEFIYAVLAEEWAAQGR